MSTENKEIEHLKRTLAATETNYAKCGSNLIDSKQEIERLNENLRQHKVGLDIITSNYKTRLLACEKEIEALKQALRKVLKEATLPYVVEQEIENLIK